MRDGRVLITGARGQLGSDLAQLLADSDELVAAGHDQLDITDDDAVAGVLTDLSPTLVINCAAFHNVDVCEREEDRSFAVNARAVKRLAQRCEAVDAKLVHFSTNYVFDGTGEDPYDEDDRPAPRSVYAISKLAGEQSALAYAPGALVIRSAGLYGLQGSASKGGNFVTRMVARARDQGEIKMVADQWLSPTFTADLADAVVEAVDAGASGLLHLTNAGECSWYEFTQAIIELAGIDASVQPGETESGPGVTQRPLNGVLRSRRLAEFGLSPLRPWRDALTDYLRRAELS